jgi:hypothetical protein
MQPSLFLQGIGNRFLYVLYKNPIIRDYKRGEYFVTKKSNNTLDQENSFYALALFELRKTILEKSWMVDIEPEAEDIFLKYRNEILNKSSEIFQRSTPRDFEYSYLARALENFYKLATLHACSDMWDTLPKLKIVDSVIIYKKNAEWALERIKKYIDYFYKLLGDWSKQIPTRHDVKVQTNLVLYVYNTVKDAGKSMPIDTLCGMTHLTPRDIERACDASGGSIYIEHSKGITPPKIMVHVKPLNLLFNL